MIIEQLIVNEYEKARNPIFTRYKIWVHPDVLAAGNWTEGQLLTEHKLPIHSSRAISTHLMADGKSYQSDILIVGKPRQRKKFRHYSRT